MSKKIPSEEDFKRASEALKHRSWGLSEVRDKILGGFQAANKLYEFFILDCSESSFRAYVFYRWNRQIKEAQESGLVLQIKDAVYDALEQVGRGKRDSIELEFEFDSHENVEQNFEGDYYNRLH